jgi:hypothetical protein
MTRRKIDVKQCLPLIFMVLVLGCNLSSQAEKDSETDSIAASQALPEPAFRYEDFEIQKGQIGSIKIGMTIAEAEHFLKDLTRQEDEAVNFGFGGGSPAYLYYAGEELILSLIPSLDTDTVLFIIAASPKLYTTNGLHPNAAVKELLAVYPDMMIEMDLMNSWEFFQDPANEWDFVFMTTPQNFIGEYPDMESEDPSKPIRMGVKADWITIY